MFLLLAHLLASLNAHAVYVPGSALFGSPALLADNAAFSERSSRFNEAGSPTQAFRELVEIIYDDDNGRPWAPHEYLPAVNEKLKEFRALACPSIPFQNVCVSPAIVWGEKELEILKKTVMDKASLAALAKHWDLEISPWPLIFRPEAFSMLVGPRGESVQVKADYWGMPSRNVRWQAITQALIADKDTYRTGFDGKDFASHFVHAGSGLRWNDWLLRDRTMMLAQIWAHELNPEGEYRQTNPIFDSTKLLLKEITLANAPAIETKYKELLATVSGAHRERFEKTRALGGYPEEVYQHVAYEQLRELMLVQGSYLSAAEFSRKGTSERQKVLESLLTMQRYAKNVRMFALEVSTLMDPVTSHAFVLDAVADGRTALTFAQEQLHAVLGIGAYKGKALYPEVGGSLRHPELFRPGYLDEYAPDIKEALKGRDFGSLAHEEQRQILELYLKPNPARRSDQALFRTSLLWLVTASDDELRKVAEVVHKAREANFK